MDSGMNNVGLSLVTLVALGACTGVDADNPTHLADMDSDVLVDVTAGKLSVELSPRSSCPSVTGDLVATVDGHDMTAGRRVGDHAVRRPRKLREGAVNQSAGGRE